MIQLEDRNSLAAKLDDLNFDPLCAATPPSSSSSSSASTFAAPAVSHSSTFAAVPTPVAAFQPSPHHHAKSKSHESLMPNLTSPPLLTLTRSQHFGNAAIAPSAGLVGGQQQQQQQQQHYSSASFAPSALRSDLLSFTPSVGDPVPSSTSGCDFLLFDRSAAATAAAGGSNAAASTAGGAAAPFQHHHLRASSPPSTKSTHRRNVSDSSAMFSSKLTSSASLFDAFPQVQPPPQQQARQKQQQQQQQKQIFNATAAPGSHCSGVVAPAHVALIADSSSKSANQNAQSLSDSQILFQTLVCDAVKTSSAASAAAASSNAEDDDLFGREFDQIRSLEGRVESRCVS